MKDLELWPLIWQTLDSLTAHYGPAIDHAAEGLGIPLGDWYGWLMAARIFDPEPVSARLLHVRAWHTNPVKLDAGLAKGVRLGLLEPGVAGEYRLTEKGHAGVEHLIQTAWAAMDLLSPMPQENLVRLADLLKRVDDACLAAPEPPDKWCLRIERHYDPGVDAPVMERLDQYLSDLVAYRDDARIAVRESLGVSGQAWEASGLLWRGVATNLDEVYEKLGRRRGWSREEYAAAIRELIERGWVAGDATAYVVTDLGRSVREEAKETRDFYFHRPFGSLSESEIDELEELLTRLAAVLAPAEA